MRTKFTVVIPTRERADTLFWTLKTCVTQDYNDLEILVSDNFSQDNTKEIVNSFKDSRIRYINTGKRLSMSKNFEYALDHVTGDYVLFLGDDDGLMPESLSDLDELILTGRHKAITWGQPTYYWPSFQDLKKRNLYYLDELNIDSQEISSQKQLEKVVFNNENYMSLAWLYGGGCVSMQIVKTIKSKCDDMFFHSMIPDIFSAIAITSSIDKYYFSKKAFSIRGVSGHSTGYSQANATLYPESNNKFFSEDVIPFHSELKYIFNGALLTLESVYQCVDLGLTDKKFKLELKKLALNALSEAKYDSPTKFNVLKLLFLEIAEENNYPKDKLLEYIKDVRNIHYLRKLNTGINFLRHKFVDVNRYKITNVYEMSLFSKNISTKYFTKYNIFGKYDTLRKVLNNK